MADTLSISLQCIYSLPTQNTSTCPQCFRLPEDLTMYQILIVGIGDANLQYMAYPRNDSYKLLRFHSVFSDSSLSSVISANSDFSLTSKSQVPVHKNIKIIPNLKNNL